MWKLVRFNPTTRKDWSAVCLFPSKESAWLYLCKEYPSGVYSTDIDDEYRCLVVPRKYGICEHYYRIEEDVEQTEHN